jgi:hypothetical protein
VGTMMIDFISNLPVCEDDVSRPSKSRSWRTNRLAIFFRRVQLRHKYSVARRALRYWGVVSSLAVRALPPIASPRHRPLQLRKRQRRPMRRGSCQILRVLVDKPTGERASRGAILSPILIGGRPPGEIPPALASVADQNGCAILRRRPDRLPINHFATSQWLNRRASLYVTNGLPHRRR